MVWEDNKCFFEDIEIQQVDAREIFPRKDLFYWWMSDTGSCACVEISFDEYMLNVLEYINLLYKFCGTTPTTMVCDDTGIVVSMSCTEKDHILFAIAAINIEGVVYILDYQEFSYG